jgi:Ca2+-binding EF-hand superfamily protein
MKKLTIAALVSVVIAGATYTAVAQHHRGGPGQMLEQVDANADGAITKSEIDAHRAEKFASADTNGDNLVSASEFEAFMLAERERRQAERREKRFAKLDANGDGMISAEEHSAADDARVEKMFERLDTDGDGVISEAEREAMKDRRGKRGMGRHG